MVTLTFPASFSHVSPSIASTSEVCILATLEEVRLSLGFFACWGRGIDLLAGEFRLELLFWRTPLVERNRLMAATAEPLDSFSACVVSSSRASASQHSSQA